MSSIRDKVIILTGATQGIGLATARLLAAKGAKLVLVARSRQDLEALAGELPGSLAIPADMRDEISIKKMIAEAHAHFSKIDILINNAGQGLNASVETIDIESYRQIFELNVIGSLIAMQQVIPIMRQQGGGNIVNISSLVSKNYFPFMSAYASTKYALNCLSLTARNELAKDNIIVSLMHPGLTKTNFGKNAIIDEETKKIMAGFFENLPQADSPEYVAERILHTIESGDAEVLAH